MSIKADLGPTRTRVGAPPWWAFGVYPRRLYRLHLDLLLRPVGEACEQRRDERGKSPLVGVELVVGDVMGITRQSAHERWS